MKKRSIALIALWLALCCLSGLSEGLLAPVDPGEGIVGQRLSFETTDVDGNPVSSDALFRDNRITLVNLWGTWCASCVDETDALVSLHARLREKGCGIVGIEHEEAPVDTMVEEIHAFMEQQGMNYPSVLEPADNAILNGVSAYPATFFVDSAGTILTDPILGAKPELYEPTIERLLADGAVKNDAGAYRVIVSDTDGSPVAGALIQMCDDTLCAFQPTDAEGVATFAFGEGKAYEVHVLQTPEGYAGTGGVLHTLEVFSDVSIVLEKAS